MDSPFIALRLHQRFDPLVPIVEDGVEIALHHHHMRQVAERAQGQAVADDIVHQRSPLFGFKRMGVMPQAVGALDLLIDEADDGGDQSRISVRQVTGTSRQRMV